MNQSNIALAKYPPLRAEISMLLTKHPPRVVFESLKLLVLDQQLQTLLRGDDATELMRLVELLEQSIQIAHHLDWEMPNLPENKIAG